MTGRTVVDGVQQRLRAIAVRLSGYRQRGVTLSPDDVDLIVGETRGCADALDKIRVASILKEPGES